MHVVREQSLDIMWRSTQSREVPNWENEEIKDVRDISGIAFLSIQPRRFHGGNLRVAHDHGLPLYTAAISPRPLLLSLLPSLRMTTASMSRQVIRRAQAIREGRGYDWSGGWISLRCYLAM